MEPFYGSQNEPEQALKTVLGTLVGSLYCNGSPKGPWIFQELFWVKNQFVQKERFRAAGHKLLDGVYR